MSGFLSQTCEDENKCSRTGKPHLSFTPGVDDKGEIIDFKTEPEAEYPPEMAGAIAASICCELQKLEPAKKQITGFLFDFTEVFSGPRAPLTLAMTMRKVNLPRAMIVSHGDTHPGAPSEGRG